MTNPRTPLPTISVDEALAGLLQQFEAAHPRPFPLEQALGLVLAEPMVSKEQHPADDTSAMDGYAVRSDDLASADADAPVDLTLVEDIPAGKPPTRAVGPGQTSRISTGGLVPEGTDAVVMREVVEVIGADTVRFTHPSLRGQNIRYAGEHLQVGEEAVKAGAVLGPAQIGMAAYLGIDEVRCHPRVKVAVLATGSELVGSTQELARGQIRDSNGVSLASAIRALGGEVSMRARVPDTTSDLDRALEKAFAGSQVVMTSGGISAGWHDLVRERIERMGGNFSFHKLRMRPGKPLAFGRCGDSHFFCLPGNPVSTLVTFEVFVKPALLKMMGRPEQPKTVQATLTERIEKKEGFTIFFRGVLEKGRDGDTTVRLTGPQGSHILKSLVDADVLIRADEGVRVLEEGSSVTVLLLQPYSLF